MHYKLYKIFSDITELLMLFISRKIDKEHLHKYILDRVDLFIKLNPVIFEDETTTYD